MLKVLIVEDDIGISNLHRKFTEKVEGFEVVGIANTIDDAFDMEEFLQPDLILLDLYFPEKNGMDLLWELRAKGSQADFILITAAKEVTSLKEALRGGAYDYIVKPVIFDRFKQSLNRFKDYRNELENIKTVEQGDIDHIMDRHQEAHDHSDMPKGIDPITLKKIIAVFEEKLGPFSAEEVGKMIGASRNTARRYLDYLCQTGFSRVDIDYGTIGRPEKKFFKN